MTTTTKMTMITITMTMAITPTAQQGRERTTVDIGGASFFTRRRGSVWCTLP
jgi:hypothetical protein